VVPTSGKRTKIAPVVRDRLEVPGKTERGVGAHDALAKLAVRIRAIERVEVVDLR
jgi:hypothetical protein